MLSSVSATDFIDLSQARIPGVGRGGASSATRAALGTISLNRRRPRARFMQPVGHSGYVAAGPRQAGHNAVGDRVADLDHDDRQRACRRVFTARTAWGRGNISSTGRSSTRAPAA